MTNAYFFVLDTLSDWELGHLTAELNSGRFFKEPGKGVPVRTVGLSREPITTLGGMRITPDTTLDELSPSDTAFLMFPGADNWFEPRYAPAMAKAKEFLAAGVPVGIICGATWAAAEAGVFDERQHTSSGVDVLRQFCPNYRGEAHYVDADAVTDGNLITADGTSTLEFSRNVLARLDVMAPETLESWYQLYKTGKPEHFHALMASLPQPVEA